MSGIKSDFKGLYTDISCPLECGDTDNLSHIITCTALDAQTLDRCRLPGYRVARGPYARVEKCPGKTNARVERCPGGQMPG